MIEDQQHNQAFPANRYARVRIHTTDGRILESDDHEARGDPEAPLADAEIRSKYHQLSVPALGPQRTAAIEGAVDDLLVGGSLGCLARLLTDAPSPVD